MEIKANILRPCQRGDVVFLETDRRYTPEQLEHFVQQFRGLHEATGVKVVLLDVGMRVVGKPDEEQT
jgi:hypothetical protein